MKRPPSGPVLRELDVLVGKWQMEASVSGRLMARGRAACEWLEGGAFLVQHVEAEPPPPSARPEWVANSPFPVVTIIALDDPSGTFCYAYADARGVRRVYRMTLSNARWRIWGQAGPEFFQQFTATFSRDADSITGRWERSRDGINWELDFDVIYRRAT
jgi:hypothetical protein